MRARRFEDECPERGEHETKLTPLCQGEQHIPQRPAAQWCSLVGERKWAVARQLVRARAGLQSRAVLWVVEQQKEGLVGVPQYFRLAKLVLIKTCFNQN